MLCCTAPRRSLTRRAASSSSRTRAPSSSARRRWPPPAPPRPRTWTQRRWPPPLRGRGGAPRRRRHVLRWRGARWGATSGATSGSLDAPRSRLQRRRRRGREAAPDGARQPPPPRRRRKGRHKTFTCTALGEPDSSADQRRCYLRGCGAMEAAPESTVFSYPRRFPVCVSLSCPLRVSRETRSGESDRPRVPPGAEGATHRGASRASSTL